MKHHPVKNAFLAGAYIVGIVYLIQAFTSNTAIQKTLIIPIGMLGLLVLSAATMGYLFLFEPYRLFAAGKREEAERFFLITLLIFAILVAGLLGAVFFLLH